MSRRSKLVALGVVGILAAAGCTQSKDGGSAKPDAKPSGRSASAPGVTADSITIGFSYLDFPDLVQRGLAPSGWGDQELAFQTLVDDLNRKDGINGRKVEVVYRPYSPLGTESAESVCLELTQDEDVFAVVGGFLGPAEPANTCIVGQQDTVLAGGVQSEERLADARAPWITGRPLRTRQASILFELLDSAGKFDGARVAVVTDQSAEDVRDSVVNELGEYKQKPVVNLLSDVAVGDITAEDNAWATFAEQIRSAKANKVLLVGNATAGIRNIAAQGLDVEVWALDSETLTNLGSSAKLEDARGTLAAASMTGQELWDDKTMAECRKTYERANPNVKIIDPNDLAETDEDIAQGISYACAMLKLFRTVADAAGPDLTNESFRRAIAKVGDFTLPGQPYASLGRNKYDANDSYRLVSFDPSIGADGGYKDLTPIRDVTP